MSKNDLTTEIIIKGSINYHAKTTSLTASKVIALLSQIEEFTYEVEVLDTPNIEEEDEEL